MLLRHLKQKEIISALPKKRVESLALISKEDEILILQPTFSLNWSLPGGIVEYEESPRETLIREIGDQFGIFPVSFHLKIINYISNQDHRGEYLQLIFSTDQGRSIDFSSLEPNPRKVKKFSFLRIKDLEEHLDCQTARAIRTHFSATATNHPAYLENGSHVF